MIVKLLQAPIHFYKKHISPHLPARCRFHPTCSQYALEALEVHGPVKGMILSIWRILRCNPFGKFGYDPVPPKGRWKSDERRLRR